MSRLNRVLTLVLSVAMVALFGGITAGTATSAPPANTGNQNVVRVTGTAANGAKFVGQFTATTAAAGQSTTGAVLGGQLTGTLTSPGPGQNAPNAQGPGAQQINQAVQMPVAAINGTCNVLDLTLGPLDLNLLGLEVHLDQVHLVINANPSGGLLGQLLCSLAGGLNGPLDTIVNLLNQILGALGGL